MIFTLSQPIIASFSAIPLLSRIPDPQMELPHPRSLELLGGSRKKKSHFLAFARNPRCSSQFREVFNTEIFSGLSDSLIPARKWRWRSTPPAANPRFPSSFRIPRITNITGELPGMAGKVPGMPRDEIKPVCTLSGK